MSLLRPAHSFVDVVKGWQQDSVSWMADIGITTGTSPTTFAPEDTLTRAHLVTFLYRYQDEPEVTLNTTTPHCDPEQTVEQTVVQYDTGDTHRGFSVGLRRIQRELQRRISKDNRQRSHRRDHPQRERRLLRHHLRL